MWGRGSAATATATAAAALTSRTEPKQRERGGHDRRAFLPFRHSATAKAIRSLGVTTSAMDMPCSSTSQPSIDVDRQDRHDHGAGAIPEL